jgi:hypothetical protein
MSRLARGHLPAGIYHVTTRTAGPIMFFDDDDRTRFCALLERRFDVGDGRASRLSYADALSPMLEVAEDSLQGGCRP